MKENDNETNLTINEVIGRQGPDDGEESNVESRLGRLEQRLSKFKHSSTRRFVTSLLSDLVVTGAVLFVLLMIGQPLVRIWAAATGNLELALYPIDPPLVQAGGMMANVDGSTIGWLLALTVAVSVVAPIIIWAIAAMIIHDTKRPWTLLTGRTQVDPARQYADKIGLRYQKLANGERNLHLETSDEAALNILSDEYDAVNRVEDPSTPLMNTVTAEDDRPRPLVVEFHQPDRIPTECGGAVPDMHACEELVVLINELPCPAELTVMVSNGTRSYKVPLREFDKPLSEMTESLFGYLRETIDNLLDNQLQDPAWTCNIRIIACPETEAEFHQVHDRVNGIALNLPETSRIESTIKPVAPFYPDPRSDPPRFPQVVSAAGTAATNLGTRPNTRTTQKQGLLTSLRFAIGSLVDDESTRSTAEAISNREIRAARHGDRLIGDHQTDILVPRAALESLLVVRQGPPEALTNALEDEQSAETPSPAQQADFLVDPDELSSTERDVAETDGGPDAAATDEQDAAEQSYERADSSTRTDDSSTQTDDSSTEEEY